MTLLTEEMLKAAGGHGKFRPALEAALEAAGLRREYIVCYAPGYPDPYMPHPNTREKAEQFVKDCQKVGHPKPVIKTRLCSDWEELSK